MSLPKDLLDQLLSGYLDDALSADERERVERLLQSDPLVAEELQQLRALQHSLRALARADAAGRKLGPAFADRVLDAAVARARAEGLADDHPLIRLAEQPASRPVTVSPRPWRVAALLVGLAASIALAVIALRPETNPPQANSMLAGTSPAMDPLDLAPERMQVGELGVREQGALAAVPGTAASDVAQAESAAPQVEPIAPAPLQPAPPAPPASSIAVAPPSMDVIGEPPSPATINAPGQLAVLMVFRVRTTSAGEASGAVEQAMRLAAIEPATKTPISEVLAGSVPASQPPGGEQAKVLYLQAPLKQLDKFHLQLLADEEGIESVEMSLLSGRPTMQVMEALDIDPTSIRHSSLELVSNNGAVEQLTNQLTQLPFAPLSAPMPLAASSASQGPDVMGQILVLVE